jgi:hypothetical protein
MKQFFAIVVIILSALCSCDTWSSDNGQLDGMWYLSELDSVSNNQSINYRERKVFWSFQGTILQLHSASCPKELEKKYMCAFDYRNNSLRVYSVSLYDRMNGNQYLSEEEISEVRKFGINSLDETFRIESLSERVMILKGSKLRLVFEHY